MASIHFHVPFYHNNYYFQYLDELLTELREIVEKHSDVDVSALFCVLLLNI